MKPSQIQEDSRTSIFFKTQAICLGLLLLLVGCSDPGKQSSKAQQRDKAQKAKEVPPSILVDDFEIGLTQGIFSERKNRLDGFQGTWARRPSYTVITKQPDTRPNSSGNVLQIQYGKVGGWCGWYTLLSGIDISKMNALTFWVKGAKGGERFDIGLADERMQQLEIDAVYVGSVRSFLPAGVSDEWQQVKIPMHSLRSELDLSRMGSLVLWFRYDGTGAIQLDDIQFTYDEEVEKILEANAPRAEKNPISPRALWVWKYDPVNQPEVREELLEFCTRTAIERMYIYLGETPLIQTTQEYQDKLADFLRESHALGIEVQALQGNPLWALKRYHSKVTEWIDGFYVYNERRPPEEWIDGVHMDIEPYLTSEWETGDRKQLKADFMELMDECRNLVDEKNIVLQKKAKKTPARDWAVGPLAEKPFVMGLAIPLFYAQDPKMEKQLLSYVDYAALMDYYDTPKALIEHGQPHVDMAREVGVQMVIGVETQDLIEMKQGKRRNTFLEEGWFEMEQSLDAVAEHFGGDPAYDGVALHCYYSYRILQKGRNVPTRERSGKVPNIVAKEAKSLINIDGDLSDWADAEWNESTSRDQVVYGVGAWKGPHDLSYKTAVMWEPTAILLAMDVRDNTVVQEKQRSDIWEGDHFEIWFDANLTDDYSESVNSNDDFQVGLSPGNFDGIAPEAFVWVPPMDMSTMNNFKLQAKKTEQGYTMEVRVPTEFLFQNFVKRVGVDPTQIRLPDGVTKEQYALEQSVLTSKTLRKGFKLGMMLDGSDTDEAHQPQKSMMSSSSERQWGDPTTFNIVELQ